MDTCLSEAGQASHRDKPAVNVTDVLRRGAA